MRNFDWALKTLDGKDIPGTEPDKPGKPLTAAAVAINALLAPNDEKLAGTEKAHRYCLAQKIHQSPAEVDLKVEDVTLIKKLVGEVYAPLVVGQMFPFLDGPPAPAPAG